MDTYRTFTRACVNWQQFSSARKRTVDRGLSYDEARRACERYNAERTPAQIRRGLKLEFTKE